MARPVHLIITMPRWFRTSRLSIKNSLSDLPGGKVEGLDHHPAGRSASLALTDYSQVGNLDSQYKPVNFDAVLGPVSRVIQKEEERNW